MFDKWLNREIEYRDSLPLSENTQCFRGRIIQLIPYCFALVEATYVTSFPVRHYDITLKNPQGLEWFRKKHHKTVYLRDGLKFAWRPINKITHIVKFTGKRWKKVNVSEEYINYLLSFKDV